MPASTTPTGGFEFWFEGTPFTYGLKGLSATGSYDYWFEGTPNVTAISPGGGGGNLPPGPAFDVDWLPTFPDFVPHKRYKVPPYTEGGPWPFFAGPSVAKVLQVPVESLEQSTGTIAQIFQVAVEEVSLGDSPLEVAARVTQIAVEVVYPFRCTPLPPDHLPNACPAPEPTPTDTVLCADDVPAEDFI